MLLSIVLAEDGAFRFDDVRFFWLKVVALFIVGIVCVKKFSFFVIVDVVLVFF